MNSQVIVALAGLLRIAMRHQDWQAVERVQRALAGDPSKISAHDIVSLMRECGWASVPNVVANFIDGVDSREYWTEVASIAKDIIDEIKDDLDDESDEWGIGEAARDRTNEWVDGHRWIIYYSGNDFVIKNGTDFEDTSLCECFENPSKTQMAYAILHNDVSDKLTDMIDDMVSDD